MTRGRWVALLACVASLACSASPAPAATSDAAATSDSFVIIDEPDVIGTDARPPLARMAPADVEARALAQPELARAQRLRPGSSVRVRYLPDVQRWRVSVRDRVASKTLAAIEIDDHTGAIVARTELPIGDYPSRMTERQAIDVAVADRAVRRLAREWGGVAKLRADAQLDEGTWEVDLFDPRRSGTTAVDPVIRVDVSDSTGTVEGRWTGVKIAWKMARGERYAFGGDVNHRYVWLPLLALFALVAVDWLRPRSWHNGDVLALLALAVSHELFLQGEIRWSVPLALPPLLWLAARMGWIFARGLPAPRPAIVPRRRLTRLALHPVPTMLIVVLCVALAGIRIGLTLEGGNVIDVGYAGVAGARLEQHGDAPWGNMPQDNPHGDTYGPANYLAYLPAVAAIDDPDDDVWGDPLPAAQATSIAADLLCALAMAAIGWRWISRRGAALAAACWLACPWTTWALASGVNDALVALPVLLAVVAMPRAWLRGGLVALAAMVKFAPLAALAPMLHMGSRRRIRQSLSAIIGAGVVVAAGLAWVTLRLDHGIGHDLHTFWQRTVGFQAERGSPFSPWGLYGWETAQRVAQAIVVLLLVAMCVRPRVRHAWQVVAGAAAAIILVELTVTHWFYLYVPWFAGLVLVLVVAQRERVAALEPPVGD